ncbi:MAG: energy-coupling factor transporter ATPase [Lachnospiraceae bacterium]|nr:energy-coupling factor transporter ATPase [Lachnospiraceae bacterium]
MSIIETKDLIFEYRENDENGEADIITTALKGVSIDVEKGDFIAVIGSNGSGKSTFAKHLNAILRPTSGTVIVKSMDTAAEENTLDIRKTAGMVFQNPDNQIIGSIVEEDVAFGLENLGMPTGDMKKRVRESLKSVGMLEYAAGSPNRLSGGQKQRVAIAGIVAMRPDVIILDEATAMLDPRGRKEVIAAVRELNEKEGMTVILITHYMDEAVNADKVFVLNDGVVAMSGTPAEIFDRGEELSRMKLCVPLAVELAQKLRERGVPLRKGILDTEGLTEELKRLSGR